MRRSRGWSISPGPPSRTPATSGEDEVFRAHEVAHQWWGIGVDFASYHDQWLSEGFSNFSGLWYLQSVSKNNDQYFDMLRQWRSSILLREGEPGPISLGYRVFATRDDDLDDYQTVVYKKGAWVVHMLRILMLDLKTMSDDRFTAMMKDFYGQYEGRRASTEDFQRVVERHAGTEMGWFFDQWVHSTATPTYRVAHRTEPAENGQFRVRLQGSAGGRAGQLPDVRAGDARSRQGSEGAGSGEGEGARLGDRSAAHAGRTEEGDLQRSRGRAGGGEDGRVELRFIFG